MKVSLNMVELPNLFSLCLPPLGVFFNLNILFMFQLSKFFSVSDKVVKPCVLEPTLYRSADQTEKGIVMTNKFLEKELNSCVGLHYDDFTILNLLKAGIKPSAIQIQSDIRIGSDSVVKQFNAHVEKLSEQLFKS